MRTLSYVITEEGRAETVLTAKRDMESHPFYMTHYTSKESVRPEEYPLRHQLGIMHQNLSDFFCLRENEMWHLYSETVIMKVLESDEDFSLIFRCEINAVF
jgi:hypothetical protein